MSGPLKIGAIIGLIAFSTPAFAQVYDGITLTQNETITGLDDAGGPRPGDPSNVVTGPFTLNLDGGDGTFVYSGTITGGTSLTLQNTSQYFLGASDYFGGTVIGSNALVYTQTETALGTGSVTIGNGGTLTPQGFELHVFNLNAQAGSTIDSSGAGLFLEAGGHSLAGTVIDQSFLTFLTGSTVNLQAENVFNGVYVNFEGTSALNLNGFDQRIYDAFTTANTTIDLGGATLFVNGIFNMGGVFTGGGTVKLDTASFMTAEGNNIFQGGVILDMTDAAFYMNGFDIAFTEDTLVSNRGVIGSIINLGQNIGDDGTLTLNVSSGQEIELESIQGSGNVVKTGAGTLTIGQSNNTGAFDIDEGTLEIDNFSFGSTSMFIDSDATLTTTAPITVIQTNMVNSGTVFTDVGQTTIISSYTGNGTLHFGLTDAASGQLKVVTAMTLLPGSSIDVTAQTGGYTLGQLYTLVDVNDLGDPGGQGTLAGATNVNGQTITTAFMEMMISATDGAGQDITLTVTDIFGDDDDDDVPFNCAEVEATNTHNRCEVFTAIRTSEGTTGDIGTVYGQLSLLSTEDAQEALDSLSGDLVPQMANVIFRHNDQFRDISLNRVGHIIKKETTDRAIEQASRPIQLASAETNTQQLAMLMGNLGSLMTATGDLMTEGFWGQAMAQRDWAREDNQLNATHYGFQGGLDTFLNDNVLIGLTGAFTTADVDMEGRPQDGTTDSYQAGVYAAYQDGAFWLSGTVAYGFHQVDYGRDINVGPIHRHAEGDYDAHGVSGTIEAAYGMHLGDGLALTPAVSVRYSGLWQEGFTETGADEANLHFDSEYDDNLVGITTLSLSQVYTTESGGRFIPQLRLGAQYDMGNRDFNRDVHFVGLPTALMDIEPAAWESRLSGLAGVGFAWIMPDDAMALIVDYDGRLNSDLSYHRLFAGLRVQW